MTALIAYYWYGLLLSFGIGLVTGWWVWSRRNMSALVEFDPYQEVIEWPSAETAPYPPTQPLRVPITPRMPIRERAAAPLMSEDNAGAELIEPVAEPDPPSAPPVMQEDIETLAPFGVTDASPEVEQVEEEVVVARDGPEPALVMAEEPAIILEAPEPAAEPDGAPDNLLLIKGIGPGLVRTLNGLGVYRFDDIASWMPEDIEMINSHLGEYRGAIIRDEWIQQARLLGQGEMDAFQQRYGHLR